MLIIMSFFSRFISILLALILLLNILAINFFILYVRQQYYGRVIRLIAAA